MVAFAVAAGGGVVFIFGVVDMEDGVVAAGFKLPGSAWQLNPQARSIRAAIIILGCLAEAFMFSPYGWQETKKDCKLVLKLSSMG